MESCCKFPLPEDQLNDLVHRAKDHALANGIVTRTKADISSQEAVSYAPMILLPSPLPRHCYEDACNVQIDFNLLMHKVAHDYSFLKECLHHTIEVDDFTRHLWNIYETVRQEGISQPMSLALNRSDYMLDCGQLTEDVIKSGCKVDGSQCRIKQVEFNTMASSFGGLCSQLSKHHRYMMELLGCENLDNVLPENDAVSGLAEGIVTAWQAYGKESAAVLFMVSDIEWNTYDQRLLEYAVHRRNPKVKVIRKSLQGVGQVGSLQEDKTLHIDGHEIAVVYFRMTYTPKDFNSEEDWATRLLIERSRAIKCPNIYYFLAGMKKVQQMLAKPGVVERFISDPDAVLRIKNTFAQLYSLDLGEEGDKAVAMAMENPQNFVVKPQREGGGNNTYGEDIRTLLSSIKDSKERNAYILMERIFPAPHSNYAVRPNASVELRDLVSELGIFGVMVGSADQIMLNTRKGHILRTKTIDTDEGGVATGFSAIDSPYLV